MIVHAAESLYWFNTTEPPYLIKGTSDIARFTSHNKHQDKIGGEKYREKKCKCVALHGLFHRNKHFGMMEHATKTMFYDIIFFIP